MLDTSDRPSSSPLLLFPASSISKLVTVFPTRCRSTCSRSPKSWSVRFRVRVRARVRVDRQWYHYLQNQHAAEHVSVILPVCFDERKKLYDADYVGHRRKEGEEKRERGRERGGGGGGGGRNIIII